ncbi:hypothetical protein AS026_29180 [Rhizobium altiplani]|uniref:Oxidoreductase molybdopterin-binding domain-containing protein n=1 Tax=Rhizobium altiplani TaxID=1864509 RepID=A0A120FQX4_9HYPH|nr:MULTISPECIES: molybdopterin-dependent oxidoreductase [Rhizobium]KWV59177.1 hypothetical protein AS026_29180 [Rhizobium altiplani]
MSANKLQIGVSAALFLIASSASAGQIILDGEVKPPVKISSEQFESFPHIELVVKGQDGTLFKYSGVELSKILTFAKIPIKGDLKGKDIDKYLVALGADGFGAVFSLPEFDAGKFIVADKLNGKPLAVTDGPLQIISPDETRRSRWVKNLVRLTIQRARP